MRVYIWCDGAAMPNGGPAGAGYVVVGGVHLLGSEALGDATNNVAEYTAVRNALRAAADAGATSAHARMDSPMVFGHLSGASRPRAEHPIQLKEEVEAQVARYPGRVTFARIPRDRNGVADELAKDGARASKALSPIGGDRFRVKCTTVGAVWARIDTCSDLSPGRRRIHDQQAPVSTASAGSQPIHRRLPVIPHASGAPSSPDDSRDHPDRALVSVTEPNV